MNTETMTLSEKINSTEWQEMNRAECRKALHTLFTGKSLNGMLGCDKVDFVRSIAGDVSSAQAWNIIRVLEAHTAAATRACHAWVGFPEMWAEALELCNEATAAMNAATR
jgi:hypothetical protein